MIVQSQVFKSALAMVAGAIPRSGPFAGLQMEGSDNTLTLAGSGDYASARVRIPAHGDLAAVVVRPTELQRVVGAVQTDDFTLAMRDNSLQVTAARSKLKVPTLPNIPEGLREPLDSDYSPALDIADWVDMVRCQAPANNKSVSNPSLKALHIEITNEHGRCVSTDGFRLHALTLAPQPTFLKCAVAAIAIADFLRFVRIVASTPIQLCVKGGRLHLRSGDAYGSFALIDGSLPSFEHMLNPPIGASCVVNRKDLKTVLGICSAFTDDDSKRVTLELAGDSLQVSSTGADGNFTETLTVTNPTGNFTIPYRLSNLTDALLGDSTTVALEVSSQRYGAALAHEPTPILIRDGQFTALCQPLRS